MESLRIHIPSELFAPAESSHFEGTVAIPVMKAGPDLYDFTGPLAWQADITNTGDALLVTGTVEGEAKTACARCLDEFSFPVTGDLEGYFLLDETKAAPEDMDDDEFEVLSSDNVIDLEPIITAALLLEFPLIPLCDEDCRACARSAAPTSTRARAAARRRRTTMTTRRRTLRGAQGLPVRRAPELAPRIASPVSARPRRRALFPSCAFRRAQDR